MAFARVLIMDDDPVFCEVLSIYLKNRGTDEITVVSDGKQATTALQQIGDDLDLITCDINMPEMDGIEVLSWLHQARVEVPILIISSTPETIFKSAQVLATRYKLNLIGALQKPLKTTELEAVLLANSPSPNLS